MTHVDPAVSSGSSPTPKQRSKKSAAPVSPISNPAPTIPLRSRHALPTPQAAAFLGVTPSWLETLTRNGLIPFRELFNGENESARTYDADDLDLWLSLQPKTYVTEITKVTDKYSKAQKEIVCDVAQFLKQRAAKTERAA